MTASENSNNDDSSVMDAVFTSDAADGTHETNSGNTVAENSGVAGADENSGERMSAANDDNLKAQPANGISTEKDKNAAPCDSAAAVQPPVKPLSTWSFIWRKLLFMIPIVNIVVLFVFAFAEGINKTVVRTRVPRLSVCLQRRCFLQLRQCCVTFTQMKLSDGFALWWRNS